MADVLIVGAGPVGLLMAAELARFGVPVRILDRAPHATMTSKALVVWSRTLELLDSAGCSQAFLDRGLRIKKAAFRSGGNLLGRAEIGDIPSPYDFALMIPQHDTEQLLAAHMNTFGVSLERQVELTAFTDAGDGVDAHLRHADGRNELCRTSWLIGCDGAHSTVRHALGLEFRGYTRDDEWILADVRLEGAGAPPGDELSIHLHADGPLAMFPMPGGRARIVASVGTADQNHPRADPSLRQVQDLCDARTSGGFKLTDPAWLSAFRINERKVEQYRRGRVFLAGDAAHVHSPAGGQGMNTGMQDAFNLAWKLAMVARRDAAASLLDSYSPERSKVGDRVLRNAGRLTEMGTLSHPASQTARNLALHFLLGLQSVQHRLAATMTEIDIAYPDSMLSVGRNSGMRLAPDRYGGAPPGSGAMPRFTLFAGDAAKCHEIAARYPTLLHAEARRPVDPKRLLIVRPDGYIGLDAHADAWREANDYLARQLA